MSRTEKIILNFVFYTLSYLMSAFVTVITKGAILVISLPTLFLLCLSILSARNGILSRSASLFLFLVLTTNLTFCYWFVLPAPDYFAAMCLALFATVYLLLKFKKMPVFFPYLFWIASVITSIHGRGILPSLAVFTIVAFFTIRWNFFHLNTFYRKPPLLSAFVFLNVFTAVFFASRMGGPSLSASRKILRQGKVHPIILFADKENSLNIEFKKSKPRFAFEGCSPDILYVAARGKHGLYRLDLNKKTILEAADAPAAGDVCFLDCKDRRLYYPGNYTNKFYTYLPENLHRVLQVYELKKGWSPMWVHVSQDKKFVLTVDDTSTIYVFKKQGNLPIHSIQIPGLSLGYPVPLNDSLFLLTSTRGILSYNFKKNEVRILIPWRTFREMHLKLAYDHETNHIYGVSDVSGTLYQFSLPERKLLKKTRLGPFIRYIQYHPEKKLIFLAEHVFGILYVVDARNLQVLDKLYVGSRTHSLTLSTDGNRLYLVSNQGIFVVDVNAYY